MEKVEKVKKGKGISKASENAGPKKRFFKRNRKDLKFGSASEGQGFTRSRKLKAMKKYANKNRAGNSAEEKHQLQETKFNKLEHARKKYEEQKATLLKEKKEKEKDRQLHGKIVNTNIQKRRKTSKDLSKKTKRGQLVMSNQINYLLEKIKKTT